MSRRVDPPPRFRHHWSGTREWYQAFIDRRAVLTLQLYEGWWMVKLERAPPARALHVRIDGALRLPSAKRIAIAFADEVMR